MITIYNIAKATGYSPSTISKVLNNYAGVSEKTRRVILDYVEKVGYVPNLSARTLITKKSWMVGVLFQEHTGTGMLHPHFSAILSAFKERMEHSGYDVLFLNQKIGNDKITYLEHCQYRGLDGVMLAVGPITNDELIQQVNELVRSPIPKVSVESIYPGVCTVISDNYGGAWSALEYLYFLGFRQIGFVRVETESVANIQRYQAYQDFLKAKNIPFQEKFVWCVPNFDRYSGMQAAKQMIENGIQNLPKAIFCVYDQIAIGMIHIFTSWGIRVPEDVSIVGFDDLDESKFYNLTTVQQNRKLIGVTAAEKLIRMMQDDDKDTNDIIIKTKLIVRESCSRFRSQLSQSRGE
jgi:DNA-binding LacI/PurR family transcriptional regulator